MPNTGSLTYWYLQLPSIILLAMIVLLLVRLVLLPTGNGLVATRLVISVTQPVVAAVGTVTPRIVPAAGVIVCAIVWLTAARIVLSIGALAAGIRL